MSSACARPANGIREHHDMRRLRTTCTEFSFQIVHFLDRLSSLHQRAFRLNVHMTRGFSIRRPVRRLFFVPPNAPPTPPRQQCREGGPEPCSSAVADLPCRTRVSARPPTPPAP